MSRTTLVRLFKRFLISMEALVNVYSGFQVKYLPCQTVLQVPLLGLGTTGKAIEMKSGEVFGMLLDNAVHCWSGLTVRRVYCVLGRLCSSRRSD